jgi:hypothetical protein
MLLEGEERRLTLSVGDGLRRGIGKPVISKAQDVVELNRVRVE